MRASTHPMGHSPRKRSQPEYLVQRGVGEAVDHEGGDAEVLVAAEVAGHGDHERPGPGGREAAVLAVFEGQDLVCLEPEPLDRLLIDLRMRLAVGDVLGGERELEAMVQGVLRVLNGQEKLKTYSAEN